MKNYFETNEKNDLEMLYEFNNKTKLFDSIKPEKEKSQIDATARRNNREFAIELKHRFINLEKYQTIMIEASKYLELMLEKEYNQRDGLYINFLDDGSVVVFNICKLKTRPHFTIQNIRSKGYEVNQLQERRYHLDLKDAVIYKKENNNYKLIHKPC